MIQQQSFFNFFRMRYFWSRIELVQDGLEEELEAEMMAELDLLFLVYVDLLEGAGGGLFLVEKICKGANYDIRTYIKSLEPLNLFDFNSSVNAVNWNVNIEIYTYKKMEGVRKVPGTKRDF